MIGMASLAVGFAFACGLYLLLSGNVQRLAMGFLLLSNGVNLLVLTASGLPSGALPPLVGGGAEEGYADPLPQAFILTAIVIGLAAVAFLLAMATRTHRELGSDELPEEDGK
jgi:multicomponent Na+:H+ antiporter subunit C